MEPEFRQARPDDAEAIAALHHRASEAAYRGVLPDALLDELTPDVRARRWRRVLEDPGEQCWLMLGRTGALLGFAHASADDGAALPATTRTIHSFYLDPERVGTGLGRRLLDVLVERAREDGVDELVLWVLASNERGLAFYAGNGFERDPRVPVREHEESGMRVLRLRRRLVETVQ